MATTGSKTVAVIGTDSDVLKFTWTAASQSIANNTTTVTWKMELISNAYGRISSTSSKNWSVTVNGTKYSGTNTVGIAVSSTKTLASGSTVIAHNSDGTKTFSYSFSQYFGITLNSGGSVGTKSGSGTGVLNTIPRSSSLTAGNGALGSAQTLTISKADSSFKHKITYTCGDVSGYAAGSADTFTTAASVSWTPALSLAAQNTTGGSVSVTLYLKTYTSSGAQIGSVTKTITCTIPASVVPTISAVAVSEATAGVAAQFGAYVQSKSALTVKITAAGVQGSTIKGYKSTLQGATYTAAAFTSKVLTASGTLSLAVTVTDTRGRTASKTVTVNVLEYSAPKIQGLTAQRCDAEGNAKDDGDYVLIGYQYEVSALNGGNTAAMVMDYKRANDTGNYTTLLTGSALSANATARPEASLSSDYTYDIRMTVTDYFGAKDTAAIVLSSAAVILDVKADGTGLAVGKTSEKSNTLEVAWTGDFQGPVQGNAMGLSELPAIPEGADLNTYLTTGCWAVYSNAAAETVANIPTQKAGRLFVANNTGRKIEVGAWGYLRQTFIPYRLELPVYEREIVQTDEVSWTFYAWQPVTMQGLGDLLPAALPEAMPGKVLWSGAYYMTNDHKITLAEKISAQNAGVMLVFSYFDSAASEAKNYWINSHFVHKKTVELFPGNGHTFPMWSSNFGWAATKYLYINDATIAGYSGNNATGTGASGLTYTNGHFVLRAVIGV